ncbi:class I SAM-dependent methyltransferase, partial [Thermodesulfobacteriota bacterium]
DFLKSDLRSLSVLDVGSSTGIMANYLSKHFERVTGIDIDGTAIRFAKKTFQRANLDFALCDAMNFGFQEKMFDVVICTHVYEHVPDADRLMREIHRVLIPKGICYFAADNRLNIIEPHYNLPFLSVMPRTLAHMYIKIASKSDFYHERHLSYWGLKRLVRAFVKNDYTKKIIENPLRFHTDYMIQKETNKARMAGFVVQYVYWLCPTYIWLLQKPDKSEKYTQH